MTTAIQPALDELAMYSQWVGWSWEERHGKRTKPPYNTRTGTLASSTDSTTWSTFADAVAARSRFDGVGFVVTPEDPFCGVDLDHCIDDDGRVADWAQAIVDTLRSYTEITPSGRGLRIFVRAQLPGGGGRKRGDVEIYDRARYFTVSGQRLAGTVETIEDRQDEIESLLATHFADPVMVPSNGNGHRAPVDLDDVDLLDRARRAKHGDRFATLYDRGDWQGAGYSSQSEADLSLVRSLLFWTNSDAARADRLFRAGGLMRPKWTSKHGGKTYGDMTIATALKSSTEGYTGNGHHQVVDIVEAPPAPAVEVPYAFAQAFADDHFVSQFIRYGAECVDSAHEYLETVALVCLAAATPRVRASLRQYPRGLPTAFYAILIGDSTRSRKSTAAGLGLDLLTDVAPDCQLAEQASPEAFVEQLAARSNDSTLWYVDELGEALDKLHHAKYMAGLRGLLLQLYEGRPYRYKRTTKRTKQGQAVEDSLVIENPNLSVLGATTESIFEIVTGRDISSGFMARFAVIMPTGRPPRRGLEEATAQINDQRGALAQWLMRIALWAKTGPRSVQSPRSASRRLRSASAPGRSRIRRPTTRRCP